MCDTCGCGEQQVLKDIRTVDVNQSVLKQNDEAALQNRKHFDEKGILAVNLISSPGSGKTTLLEKTADSLKTDISLGVLEGDIETELDAERIRKKGVPAVQLTTGGACHLDASLIHNGFHSLEHQTVNAKIDILFIENVGNLVCPSFFRLGEHIRAVLVSVPEGPDKPLKYPKAFMSSHVFIITKSDLLEHFDFDLESVMNHARSINPSLRIFVTSAKTGEGMDEWYRFLHEAILKR